MKRLAPGSGVRRRNADPRRRFGELLICRQQLKSKGVGGKVKAEKRKTLSVSCEELYI